MQNNLEYDVKEISIIQLMQKTELFAKTICSPIGNNESWDLLISQLKDPERNRHLKNYDDERIDRTQYYDTKKGEWTSRFIKQERGLPKNARFTKKTSVSFLPPDGKMSLFLPGKSELVDSMLCLLWDSNECDLKDEKFIFSENANTHSRWWLGRKNAN